jgi:serine/threonine protein kinase
MSDPLMSSPSTAHEKSEVREEKTGDCLFLYDDSRYPAGFFTEYEALSCLSSAENAETLLVRERKTGAQRIAKCYLGENRVNGETESQLLQKLSHPGIPRYVATFENEDMLCVVRAYVEGLALHEFVAQKHPTPGMSVSIASQICDILAYLHNLNPPVIHRDIKPQNIIIDESSNAWLIDFGISREYNADAATDTRCFGTVDFAPPEQYGFSQTDNRTDIFSLGVLLGWLLTGESQPRKALPKLDSPRLQKIVQTCTELTPERRYPSAELVKKALLRADGRAQKRIWRICFCVAASLFMLCAGFAIGRYTAFFPKLFSPAGVMFQEPLIEQAVRASLNLPADATIEEDDLLRVNELYIYGNMVVEDGEAFSAAQNRMVMKDPAIQNGGIRSLADLAKLPRLKIIHIALQNITDLSPLAQLSDLEIIDLMHNPIESVEPLARLYSLRELNVFESHVSDLSPLISCPQLFSIDAGKSRVATVASFSGIASLKRLSLRKSTLTSLDGIEALAGLQQIVLGDVRDRSLTPLLSLPLLKEVSLSEDLRAEALRDLARASFQISFY